MRETSQHNVSRIFIKKENNKHKKGQQHPPPNNFNTNVHEWVINK